MAVRVTVAGAGIIGLSCAVRLAEIGLEVNVVARELPRETMSAAAGGLWLPHPAEPLDDVARWAGDTLAELRRLALQTPDDGRQGGHGVRIMVGTLLHHDPVPEPAWAHRPGDDVRLSAVRQPAPGYGFGYRVALPVVDVPRYLDHLVRRLEAAGGTLTRMPLTALPTRGVLVNCTGVAARALARDPQVRPVRGQSLLLADPGLAQWWCDDAPGSLTYVVPRGRDVLVGGTLEDGDWDTTPSRATAERLRERAVRLVPALRDAPVLGHRVGLRPTRPAVRVEAEPYPTPDDDGHLRVHCYGHGGSGITLSWGSAGAVRDAVLHHLSRVGEPAC